MKELTIYYNQENNGVYRSLPFPFIVFEQIEQLIADYNREHPEEMLIKSSKQLHDIYNLGLSIIAIHPNDPNLVIAHAALYPLGISNLTEGRELYEFGSWIVHPNHRHQRTNGLTIGEIVGKELVNNSQFPLIATIKRQNTQKALEKIGFEILNFGDYPIITTLTCSCPNSSEHFNNSICYHRANIPGQLINHGSKEPPKIACTLMGYNVDEIQKLEQLLERKLDLIGQAVNFELFMKVKKQLSEMGILML